MPKRINLYTGQAGHLAVMAELLLRGWNTAIPEVDVGDDIFVVHDRNGDLRRVQVKTAVAKVHKYGYSAQFNLPLSQLQRQMTPDITYIFAVRLQGCWKDFVVIDRQDLERRRGDGMGSESKNSLRLWLSFKGTSIICSRLDLSQYRNDWDTRFPVIEH
ncbi:MAG: hypothetical protein OXH81_15860 [Gemmatimonadetes bacterium]|nr:hypothetical protein [Gemmatimonadota bacterium]